MNRKLIPSRVPRRLNSWKVGSSVEICYLTLKKLDVLKYWLPCDTEIYSIAGVILKEIMDVNRDFNDF